MKANPNNYDYVMYVDASGDDGFSFEKGATTCYAAASLLVRQEDISHNLDILNRIKKIVGCKETDEVKYSRVRRHRRASEALAQLSGIKGVMAGYVVFKKEVDQTHYKGNKNMSVVCHYMALRTIVKTSFQKGSRILLAIDHMKSTEEVPLNHVINTTTHEKMPNDIDLSVVFRDSKDANFLLIQIADLLCGILREHFEQYEINLDMRYFSEKCPPCETVFEIRRKASHLFCKRGKSIAKRITESANLKHIINLFPDIDCPEMLSCFYTEPPHMMRKHFYMVCSRKK